MYKKQERVFDAVKECVQNNIALHVSHLKEQLLQSNGDNIAIMDSFWFHLHRSILTTASLLVYVSQYDKKLSVLDYATNEVKSALRQQDDEMASIQNVFSSIMEESQKYRDAFLEQLKTDMEEEGGAAFFAESRKKQIVNVVDMIDSLDLFQDLKARYFSTMQAFYRTYAYELFLRSELPVYLDKIRQIVKYEKLLARDFFKTRVEAEVRHQVLQCCVGLFASELVAKGLQSIIENQELDALAQLYAYYEDVAQLDVLKEALVSFIAQLQARVFTQRSIPEVVRLFGLLQDVSPRCFANNAQFLLEIRGALMALVNGNMDVVCERLVRWIDDCVCRHHREGAPMPPHFVEDVLLLLNLMNQKESFEALYRGMLFRHVLAFRDQLLPEEMRVIDEMKAICGNVFVSKMDALAKDAISSREFAAYVRSECFGSRLFQRSQFHIISKDASFANEFPDLALPPELLQLKEEFAALYQKKYSSRLLQFLFEKSEYTLQYTLPDRRAVDLVVSLPQYLVLNAFSTVDAFTAGDLQTLTNLPLSVVLETARCLAKPENGPLLALTPGATDNATTIALFESPSFSAPRVRLVPAPVLSAHTQAPMAAQDMSQMHKTRVDAAIVRIIKNAKFIGFSALWGS